MCAEETNARRKHPDFGMSNHQPTIAKAKLYERIKKYNHKSKYSCDCSKACLPYFLSSSSLPFFAHVGLRAFLVCQITSPRQQKPSCMKEIREIITKKHGLPLLLCISVLAGQRTTRCLGPMLKHSNGVWGSPTCENTRRPRSQTLAGHCTAFKCSYTSRRRRARAKRVAARQGRIWGDEGA